MKPIRILLPALLAALLSGCSENGSSGPSPSAGSPDAFWFASDYQSGELRSASDSADPGFSRAFWQDSKVVSFGGGLWVLERFGADNLARVEPSSGDVLFQISLGKSSNPADLVPAGNGVGALSLAGTDELLFVDLASGETESRIDLSRFAPEGGSAAPGALAAADGKLYVALERFVDYVSVPEGMLAVVDSASRRVVDSVLLGRPDPFDLAFFGGRLIVACKGTSSFDADWNETSDGNGALLSVDPASLEVSELADEKALGGKPSALASGASLWTAVYRAWDSQTVAEVRFSGSAVSFEPLEGVENAFGGIDALGDRLLVGDRTAGNSRVRLFEGGVELYSLGAGKGELPPSSVAFLR